MGGRVVVMLDALVVTERNQRTRGVEVAAERLGECLGLMEQRRDRERIELLLVLGELEQRRQLELLVVRGARLLDQRIGTGRGVAELALVGEHVQLRERLGVVVRQHRSALGMLARRLLEHRPHDVGCALHGDRVGVRERIDVRRELRAMLLEAGLLIAGALSLRHTAVVALASFSV